MSLAKISLILKNITYLLLPHGLKWYALFHLELRLLGYPIMAGASALLVSFGLGASMELPLIFGIVTCRIVRSLKLITLILLINNFIFPHLYFLLFLKQVILIWCLYLTLLCFNFSNFLFFIIPKQHQPIFQVFS